MKVRILGFELFHNKANTGSGKIRVENLIKYWEEADKYRYGDYADVMIFQKVYCTYDYKYPKYFPNIKILDVCDPDWFQTPDIYIKETIDAMDAIVVPTRSLKKLMQQMTRTPVKIIKDRFDLSEFPKRKIHKEKLKKVIWFGYAHNAELLRFAVPSFEKRGLELMVVSDENPQAYRWANDSKAYEDKYTYYKYDNETAYEHIQEADICVLPKGYRPQDKYKSENKTVMAQLLGLPVVSDADELDKLIEPEARNRHIDTIHSKLKQDYDCRLSVKEYQDLIQEIMDKRKSEKSEK